MDEKKATGSEQNVDGRQPEEVAGIGFFNHLRAAFDAANHSDFENVQVLCANKELLLLLNSARAFNTKDITRVAIARLVSYDQDRNLLLTLMREGHKEGWSTIVINQENSALKSAFDHLQLLEEPFSIAAIQPSLGDIHDQSDELSALGKPWLIDQTLIGLQRHRDLRMPGQDLGENCRKISLAEATSDLAACEPHLRRSSLVSIDFDALAASAAGIGFDGQAASQLAHYAGRSSYCKLLIINSFTIESAAANLIAPILWYFMYGLEFRLAPDVQQMRSYLVEHADEALTFYSDERTQKWWLANTASSSLKAAFPLLACSYADYSQVIKEREFSPDLQALRDLYENYRPGEK